MKIKNLFLLILILFLFQCCASSIQKENQTFSFYSIEYYKTIHPPKGIIIQLDPISLPKNVMEKFWIPFWLKENYYVVQIIQNDQYILSAKELQSILDSLISDSSKYSDNIILSGISLGGISILDWLNESENIKGISKILLMGTGWDYDYSGNLFYENPKLFNHRLGEIDDTSIQSYKTFLATQYDSTIVNNFYIPTIKLGKKIIKNLDKHKIPILIVIGKIDSFSPEDSIITFIKNYKNCPFKTTLNKCYYIEASRANFFDKDYNHFDLFLYNDVEDDLYEDILEWINKY